MDFLINGVLVKILDIDLDQARVTQLVFRQREFDLCTKIIEKLGLRNLVLSSGSSSRGRNFEINIKNFPAGSTISLLIGYGFEVIKSVITEDQIKALKYFILNSKDCGPETKKACFAMLDASEMLTEPVFYTGNSADIAYGIHDMQFLNEFMRAMNTRFHFSHHCGYFLAPGQLLTEFRPGEDHTHTIFLSEESYCKTGKEVLAAEVNCIKLIDPLYGQS